LLGFLPGNSDMARPSVHGSSLGPPFQLLPEPVLVFPWSDCQRFGYFRDPLRLLQDLARSTKFLSFSHTIFFPPLFLLIAKMKIRSPSPRFLVSRPFFSSTKVTSCFKVNQFFFLKPWSPFFSPPPRHTPRPFFF